MRLLTQLADIHWNNFRIKMALLDLIYSFFYLLLPLLCVVVVDLRVLYCLKVEFRSVAAFHFFSLLRLDRQIRHDPDLWLSHFSRGQQWLCLMYRLHFDLLGRYFNEIFRLCIKVFHQII